MDATRSVPEAKESPVLSAELLIHGQRLNVAALGPEHVVVLKVDGQLMIYHVDLPAGIDPTRHEQRYRMLKTA